MEQSQVNQKQLIAQFAGKQFRKFGIRSVSMDDIAQQLGISKKTIYQFFENKKELVRVFVVQFINGEKNDIENMASTDQNAIETLTNIYSYAQETLKKFSKSFMYDLYKYYRSEWDLVQGFHKEYLVGLLVDNLKQGKTEGLYIKDINEVLIKLHVESLSMIMNEDLFPNEKYDKQKLIKDYLTYHLKAISTEKGKKTFEN